MSDALERSTPLYRCRACGETEPSPFSVPFTAATASVAMALFGRVDVPESRSPRAVETHACKGGNVGLADCIGFRDVPEGA